MTSKRRPSAKRVLFFMGEKGQCDRRGKRRAARFRWHRIPKRGRNRALLNDRRKHALPNDGRKRALSDEGASMRPKRKGKPDMIECALFGAGRIGKIHAGNVARESGAKLKYVIDPNTEAASALAAAHGATAATTEQVFADNAIGAVMICSYTDTHADLILAAAAAGKQIFCEKPIDLAIDRARSCAEAVARAGVTCMIGFQRRFDPTFSAIKTRLVAGEIGTPEMLI